MRVVLEFDAGALQFAAAFDIDHARRGDQDVGYGAVTEQWLERTESEDFIEHFFDELVLFQEAERGLLFPDEFGNGRPDLLTGLFSGASGQSFQVDTIEQLAVNAELQFLIVRGYGRRRRCVDGARLQTLSFHLEDPVSGRGRSVSSGF